VLRCYTCAVSLSCLLRPGLAMESLFAAVRVQLPSTTSCRKWHILISEVSTYLPYMLRKEAAIAWWTSSSAICHRLKAPAANM
jgi:hypothetical protein